MEHGSKQVSSAAIRMALTDTREDEQALRQELASIGIEAAVVDYGGGFFVSAKKIMD